MDFLKSLPFIFLLVILGAAVWQGKNPPPDKGDQKALVPTTTTLTGLRVNDDRPLSDIKVTYKPTGESWSVSLYDGGVPYQDKQQSTEGHFEYEYVRRSYPIDLGLDLGLWTGFRPGHGESESVVDCGLRVSPGRFAWGTVSPDLLISPNAGGIGVSLYAPTHTVSGIWGKLGIGAGWVVGYRSGDGFMPYAALSTRF